jgi:hypothetical protein
MPPVEAKRAMACLRGFDPQTAFALFPGGDTNVTDRFLHAQSPAQGWRHKST